MMSGVLMSPCQVDVDVVFRRRQGRVEPRQGATTSKTERGLTVRFGIVPLSIHGRMRSRGWSMYAGRVSSVRNGR